MQGSQQGSEIHEVESGQNHGEEQADSQLCVEICTLSAHREQLAEQAELKTQEGCHAREHHCLPVSRMSRALGPPTRSGTQRAWNSLQDSAQPGHHLFNTP